MLATLVKPRGRGIYYVIALLTFPAIHILGTVLANMLHGRTWFPKVNQGANLAYATFVTFFSVFFFAGGLNEESGWRGFAQKHLQTKYNPLTAIFILWLFVVIWHIPNDLLRFRNGENAMLRLVIYLFITMLFSWIYNRTDGSILVVAVFHASMTSMNRLTGVFPLTTTGILLLIGFAMTAMIQDRMWCRLPKDHPAVHQVSA
jgi:membrane protease YdiL (CAAX protease family)